MQDKVVGTCPVCGEAVLLSTPYHRVRITNAVVHTGKCVEEYYDYLRVQGVRNEEKKLEKYTVRNQ